MKKTLLILAAAGVATSAALAETVYVTARPSPCTATANCPGANPDGTYTEQFPSLGDYGVAGSAPGHPQTAAARTYISSPEITDPTNGVVLTPTLATPGGIYKIDYNFNSIAGNTSTNVILSVACTSGGTLSFSETDKFQRQYGSPANQWQLLGYLTNNPGSATPTIEFRYKSGRVSGAGAAAAGNRLLFDCWRFTLLEPCLAVDPVEAVGPLGATVNEVTVSKVLAGATAVTAYQNTGSGWTQIGTKTTGVVAGNNSVSVTGLVKGAQVSATQTINGQEGCVPASGALVGGGANPTVRIALTIRETTNLTATVGAPGNTASTSLHFLGVSNVIGGAPIEAPLYYPSNEWQTVSFERGSDAVPTPGSITAGVQPPPSMGYGGLTEVQIQVYAFKTIQPDNVKLFSSVPAQSANVTSNEAFAVNWSWPAVDGAEGYRVLRSLWGGGFFDGIDVPGNTFLDVNDLSLWIAGTEVNTNSVQMGASIQWNPSVAKTNALPGIWGTLESINFAIDNLTDTGPFDLYVDNLSNGTNVFQTFEAVDAGTTDYGFRSPSYSGTTSANILSAPNIAAVSQRVADTGSKSLRLSFQWNGLTQSKWLRLTTSGAQPASNPFVNLNEPISFRMLMIPVGGTLPPEPTVPMVDVGLVDGQVVLNWEGSYRLQTTTDIGGTFTNVVETPITGPWTNSYPEGSRFFRLAQ